mgnify:CR=1 FL=1
MGVEVILAVLGALATVLPVLVKIWNNRIEVHREKSQALQTHSLTELHAGRDGVRALQQAPPAVQPDRPPAEL